MIRYALACDAGHRFESWFASSGAFDDLAADNLVGCPICGSTDVAKAIMTPAVVAKRPAVRPATPDAARGTIAQSPEPAAVELSSLSQERREVRALVAAFREKVFAATQDVGRQFPDQARRMHEGEIPHREIRGQATVEEARSLLEDGVLVVPIPGLPDDWN